MGLNERSEEASGLESVQGKKERREVVIGVGFAVMLLLLLGGAWFAFEKFAAFESRLSEFESSMADAESDLERAIVDITTLESNARSLAASLDAELGGLDASLTSLRGEVDLATGSLFSDFSALEDSLETGLVGLGRCLYHEAELHRYTYYFLTDVVRGVYVTDCD